MGGVISYSNCPYCNGKESVYVDYNYRTQEETCHCMNCGYESYYRFKRDENGQVISDKEEFPISSCSLVVVDYETREVIWEMPLSKVKNLNQNLILDWLNGKWAPEKIPNGMETVYSNGERVIWYLTRFDIENDTLKIENPQWEEGESLPSGLVQVKYKNSIGTNILTYKNCSKNDFLEIVEKIKADNDVEEILKVSWYNNENKKVEEIAI